MTNNVNKPSYARALQWAKDKKARGRIAEPSVLGATLQLGRCCDFLESRYINLLAKYYDMMKIDNLSTGNPLPENKDAHGDPHKDKLLRYLDCAVIEFMHTKMRIEIRNDYSTKGFSEFTGFDSIRGAFLEVDQFLKVQGFLIRAISSSASETQNVLLDFSSHWKKCNSGRKRS